MSEPRRTPARPPGTIRLGAMGDTEILVSLSWLGIAALIAVAVAPHVQDEQPGIGAGAYLVGVVVAVVLYLAVLLHEISHVVVVRRFGHAVPSVTLSFMGGRTAVEGEAATPREELLASVVGPITSLAIGAVAAAALLATPDGVLRVVVEALAWSNLGLGLLNLVPVLPLDGGRVLKAVVWRLTGSSARGTVVAAWAGRVAAALLVLYVVVLAPALGHHPGVLDLVLVGVVGVFLWGASSAELTAVRLRGRFSVLVASDLARRTLAVAPDLPLAEAIRQAQEAEAGAIVTVDSAQRPLGLVQEAAVQRVPRERRPWVSTSAVARGLAPALCLPVAITGDQLLQAITGTPASEYLLVDPDGGIFGVLALSDVDKAVGLT